MLTSQDQGISGWSFHTTPHTVAPHRSFSFRACTNVVPQEKSYFSTSELYELWSLPKNTHSVLLSCTFR